MTPAPNGASLALEVAGLTKRYGGRTVIDGLSFTAAPGRVTGFLGPNGAGKSTTMKIMLGLAAADEGSATIGGRRYVEFDDPVGTVGALLEHDAYHPGRSGRNHLLVQAEASGIPAERVDEVLELVEIADAADRHVGAYSLGMRQRLGLAGALLGDPPVLILDEPGNGLDPDGIRTLRALLRARAAAGCTVFVSSHLLGEVELLADDVVVIHRGRLLRQGALRELQQPAALVRTPSRPALESVLTDAGGSVTRDGSDRVVVRGLSLEDIGQRAFAAGIALLELSPSAGSLEELFIAWTHETGDASVEVTA